MSEKCKAPVEVYSRVCGFFRPVQQWNKGKKQEFADRTPFVIQEGLSAIASATAEKKTAVPGGPEQRLNKGGSSIPSQ